jgi:hypothetical protein
MGDAARGLFFFGGAVDRGCGDVIIFPEEGRDIFLNSGNSCQQQETKKEERLLNSFFREVTGGNVDTCENGESRVRAVSGNDPEGMERSGKGNLHR